MQIATTIKSPMSILDRFSRVKYKLWKKFRFFAFLIEHLTFIENASIGTAAINRYGHFSYSPNFLNGLSDDELMGLTCHEVLHLALKHPERGQGRDLFVGGASLFNVAIDILVNYICLKNGLVLPKCGIIPDLKDGGSIDYQGCYIDNIEKKCVEEIYDILKTNAIQNKEKIKNGSDESDKGDGSDKGNESDEGNGSDGKDESENESSSKSGKDADKREKEKQHRGGFDCHDFSKKPEEEQSNRVGKTGKKLRDINWDAVIQVALNNAKQIGQSPAGFGREFEVYQKGFINWRQVLARIVASASPRGYSWESPDRRLIPFDIYIPHVTGDTVKVLFSIDTSGSISKDELSKYITEIISLSKSFDGVEMRILTHDVEVHDDYFVGNGSIAKIKTIALHGGGGTSHTPLYEYIERKKYNRGRNLLVSMTDGFSQFPDKPSIDTIFVLSSKGSIQHLPSWRGKVIELL